MDLRVTPQTLVSRTIANARRQSDLLAKLQEQASTGNRLLRPSDGPVDTVALLANKAHSLRLDMYLDNVRNARATLDSSVTSLREASDVLSKAREVAIEGSHAGNDAASLEALAQEVDSLLNRMLDVANTQQAGRYLFAGTATGTQPFAVTSEDAAGRPQTIAYSGSQERSEQTIGPGQTVDTLYAGNQVFQPNQRGTTTFTGETGAGPGSGTDSATGQGTLIVRHTATTYAAGSGVQAGANSPSGDSIIGPAGSHRLTIVDTSGTGASGIVSLDGGPAIAFTSADTNLKVGGPNGTVVYVDTTGISPGFSGDVDITADGTLSVDNGASTAAIDFSGNQVVTNSDTGEVTNVSSANIRQVGAEHLDYTGTYDAFQVLMALRDDLRNTRGLTAAQQAESISERLGELDHVRAGVLSVIGEQSASLQNLEAVDQRIQDVQVETAKRTSDLESADISEVVLSLQSQENLLRLTFAAAARVMDQSLLDFLK